jgi:hypothetical protein
MPVLRQEFRQDRIEAEMLKKVEHAEGELFQMEYTDFRVRVFHGAARLQFQPVRYDACD